MSQIQKAPSGRVRRQPVGKRNRLSIVGKEPGYEYRIAMDKDDNIAALQEAGYEFVPADKVRVGDKRVNVPSSTEGGQNATVSLGGGRVGYVMRQKQEWYDEDQAAKRAEVIEVQNTIKRDKKGGDYGRIKIGDD